MHISLLSSFLLLAAGPGAPTDQSCVALSDVQATVENDLKRGDLPAVAKRLSEHLARCEATLPPDKRARLWSDLALVESKRGRDEPCARAAERGLAIGGLPPKLIRALSFNRSLCGGSCDPTAPGCREGAGKRRKALANRRVVEEMCKGEDAVHAVTFESTPLVDGSSDYELTNPHE